MEVFGILGYLFGLRALQEVQDVRNMIETEQVKRRWKEEQCIKNIHFEYLGKCSACGIKLRNF